MKKLLISLVLMALLTVSIVPAFADSGTSAPVIYESTFTVTNDGGTFQVGFVKVEFKKNFMGKSMMPITFHARVYAINGAGCIEFSPDVAAFVKDVKIKVGHYKGALFDEVSGKNIKVNYQPQTIIASHFSRYCWH